MEQRKSLLYYSVVTIAAFFTFLGMLNSFRLLDGLDGGAVYLQAEVVGIALGVAWILYALGMTVRPTEHGRGVQLFCRIVQYVIVLSVLVMGVYVRVETARSFTLQAEQQDRITYEIARYIQEGSLQEKGSRYCDYLSENPYYFGYSWLLSIAFRLFGPYVNAGQYLNLFFAAVGLVFLYGCGKRMGGFWYGLAAMLLGAFWPSQILQVVLLSPTIIFTTMTVVVFYLYLKAIGREYSEKDGAARDMVRFILVGVVLAFLCSLHPTGWIFTLIILLDLCTKKRKLPDIPLNDLPLTRRFISKGYRNAILAGLSMILMLAILTTHVELATNRDVVSSWRCAEKYLSEDFSMPSGSVRSEKIEQYLEQLTQTLGRDGQLYLQLQDSFQKQKELTTSRMQILGQAENSARFFYPVLILFVLLSLIRTMTGSKQIELAPVCALLALLLVPLFPAIADYMNQIQFVAVLLLAVDGACGLFQTENHKARMQQVQTTPEAETEDEKKRKMKQEETPQEFVKLPKKEEDLAEFDLEKEVKDGHIVITMTETSQQEYLAARHKESTDK